MRLFLILTLFGAIGCRAEDTSNITNKVFEKKDKDGKTATRIETIFRGVTKVMMVMSRRNSQGALVVAARSYLVGGDLVMTESDENSDGIFETIAIYGTDKRQMEIFTRGHDGSVGPASTQRLQAYKTQNSAMREFWDKAFQKDIDDDRIGELFEETQKKIQDVERRKTDK